MTRSQTAACGDKYRIRPGDGNTYYYIVAGAVSEKDPATNRPKLDWMAFNLVNLKTGACWATYGIRARADGAHVPLPEDFLRYNPEKVAGPADCLYERFF
jgi:hypothetical protein